MVPGRLQRGRTHDLGLEGREDNNHIECFHVRVGAAGGWEALWPGLLGLREASSVSSEVMNVTGCGCRPCGSQNWADSSQEPQFPYM